MNYTSFQVFNEDVLLFPHHGPFDLPQAFKCIYLKEHILNRLDFFDKYHDATALLSFGMDCSLIKTQSTFRQQGKLKITIEFIPEISDENVINIEKKPYDLKKDAPSLLDQFRQ